MDSAVQSSPESKAMADVFHASDFTRRAVWVVIDPRDGVTGDRVSDALDVRLTNVSAVPIIGRSGVYCFTDLELAAGPQRVRVRARGPRDRYVDAERTFNVVEVPVAGQPLNRNLVTVDLMPRASYPFSVGTTLARGRLVAASDGTPIPAADIALMLAGFDQLRGRTDEQGEFVVPFPPADPGNNGAPGPIDLPFQLRFEVAGLPSHVIPQETVEEGLTILLGDLVFPGT
jgi:hypothetical protein